MGAGVEVAARAKGTAITKTVTKASVQGAKRLMREPYARASPWKGIRRRNKVPQRWQRFGYERIFPLMDERTIAFYDRHAAETASRHRSLDPAPWRPRFLAAFRRGGNVLDVGCGCGRDLALLLELGFDARGTEPSAGMRAEAERAYPALAGRILPHALPLPDPAALGGPFDGVICSAVLMHVPPGEISEALASLRRALRTGGHLWLTVPGPRSGLDAVERDEGGRLFRDLPAEPLIALCRENRLRELSRWDEPDRLGRMDIRWRGCLLEAVGTR